MRAFERMSEGVLRTFGKDSLLVFPDTLVETSAKVAIRYGVTLEGADDVGVFHRAIATVSKTAGVKSGCTLKHPDGTFKFDNLLRDNGTNHTFVLVPYSV